MTIHVKIYKWTNTSYLCLTTQNWFLRCQQCICDYHKCNRKLLSQTTMCSATGLPSSPKYNEISNHKSRRVQCLVIDLLFKNSSLIIMAKRKMCPLRGFKTNK